MNSREILPLLLALFGRPGACPRPEVPAVEFVTLTEAEAAKLEGRRRLFRVDLDSAPDERGPWVVFDCTSPDDTLRTVWLRRGQDEQARMTVRARLRRLWHEPGQGFAGFWEYRLEDAAAVVE